MRDGDIIFVDSGTTTTHIMNGLRDLNVTIITNNLEVVNQGLDNPRNRIIVLPGELHRRTHSTASDLSIEYLKRFNITTAFMAATGVSASGVTNSSPLEYAIKKTAVQIAGKTVLMVTSNKFGITSLLTYASLDQLDLVITDSGITEKYRQLLAASHTALDTVVF